MTDAIAITATGIFTWPAQERQSDRYGQIGLDKHEDDNDPTSQWSSSPADHVGRQAHITVEVLETRESRHIGDLFRGIGPVTPDVGEIVDLGIGELFVEATEWFVCVGLKPDDERTSDWFDPRKLYRLHDQTVRITVEVLA